MELTLFPKQTRRLIFFHILQENEDVPYTLFYPTPQGHKICEPCSEKEAVVSCPTCKTAFMGRDYGMEAFIRELSGVN